MQHYIISPVSIIASELRRSSQSFLICSFAALFHWLRLAVASFMRRIRDFIVGVIVGPVLGISYMGVT